MKVSKGKHKTNYYLVNYADENYSQSQEINTKTGITIGGFNKVFSYSPNDIDDVFFENNKHIFEQKRGGGFWLWKPYVIKKAFENIKEGDYIFYCDSGSYFVNSIQNLIDSIQNDDELIVFELEFIEKFYTKRDAFILMNCDTDEFHNSKQMLASFSLWKKSKFTIEFLDEWLKYSQDERIITDLENKCGFDNLEEFIDHRHDQSIFSILSKKHKIIPYRDISQYGNSLCDNYPNSNYPQLLEHTRKRNVYKKSVFYRSKKYLIKIIKSFYS